MFQQAMKEPFTLKMAIAGIAGVGKTYTSFQLATLLSEGQPFAVIDTENRKSRKYADLFRFDVSDLETTFSLGAYTREIKAAEAAGYKVLVIDGLSQLWDNKDGIKDLVEMIARRDKIPAFTAWQQGNALLFDFIKLILDSPLHILCTLRSKTEYTSSVNDNNKTQYRRVGLAPIQKDNLEFEFDLFAEMDHEHHLIFQKSLCTKLSGKVLPMAGEGAAKKLTAILTKWMAGSPQRPVEKSEMPVPAASTPIVPLPDPTAQPSAQPAQDTPDPKVPTDEPTTSVRQADQPTPAPAQPANLTVVEPLMQQIVDLADKRFRGGYGALHTLLVKQGLPQDQFKWTEEQRLQAWEVLKQNMPAPPSPAKEEQASTGEPATEAQIASIQRLYERLGKETPGVPSSYAAAKELIAQLSQEYKQSRARAS